MRISSTQGVKAQEPGYIEIQQDIEWACRFFDFAQNAKTKPQTKILA
jgi:hypothetical protein